ncbi:MAG TPA: RluA family pseudouridine synthase [Candidatus Polarisedimenticolaceae bacterium]|nr:RluA family pseudouridine synthase [Candidatus Polarisedimenticolaceae bacterium]
MSEPVSRFPVGRRDTGKRLDRFLHERIPGLSRTRIQRVIRARVRLSWGATPRPATPVRAGEEVTIVPRPRDEVVRDLRLDILARGDGWLAVDKPPRIPVHPVHDTVDNSVIRLLRRQLDDTQLRLVHRLDAETSGVLLVARTVEASRRLARAFMERTVGKHYLALVRGNPVADGGTIDLPIGPARGSRVWIRLEAGHGKPARTDWRVARRFGERTLVRLSPATGRRHQLRVHMTALGHPILGDILYGRTDDDYLRMVRGEGDARASGGPRRQLLHCSRLEFEDPGSGARCAVSAALPADFVEQLAAR